MPDHFLEVALGSVIDHMEDSNATTSLHKNEDPSTATCGKMLKTCDRPIGILGVLWCHTTDNLPNDLVQAWNAWRTLLFCDCHLTGQFTRHGPELNLDRRKVSK